MVRYQQIIKKEVNHYYIDHTTQRQQRLWETGRQLRWPAKKDPEVLTQKLEYFGNSRTLGTRLPPPLAA